MLRTALLLIPRKQVGNRRAGREETADGLVVVHGSVDFVPPKLVGSERWRPALQLVPASILAGLKDERLGQLMQRYAAASTFRDLAASAATGLTVLLALRRSLAVPLRPLYLRFGLGVTDHNGVFCHRFFRHLRSAALVLCRMPLTAREVEARPEHAPPSLCLSRPLCIAVSTQAHASHRASAVAAAGLLLLPQPHHSIKGGGVARVLGISSSSVSRRMGGLHRSEVLRDVVAKEDGQLSLTDAVEQGGHGRRLLSAVVVTAVALSAIWEVLLAVSLVAARSSGLLGLLLVVLMLSTTALLHASFVWLTAPFHGGRPSAAIVVERTKGTTGFARSTLPHLLLFWLTPLFHGGRPSAAIVNAPTSTDAVLPHRAAAVAAAAAADAAAAVAAAAAARVLVVLFAAAP